MDMSDTLAIAAHLHVLLRRKTGRVTDTEWMAENREYGLEIVRFARAKAQELGQPDLHEWAQKLDRALQAPTSSQHASMQRAAGLLRGRGADAEAARQLEEPTGSTHPVDSTRATEPSRYVGGIR